MRLIDSDKLKIEHIRRGFEIFGPHVSLNQLLLAEEVKAIPIKWIDNWWREHNSVFNKGWVEFLHYLGDMLEDWEKENEKN